MPVFVAGDDWRFVTDAGEEPVQRSRRMPLDPQPTPDWLSLIPLARVLRQPQGARSGETVAIPARFPTVPPTDNEIAACSLAHRLLERKLAGRRKHSKLPALIDLVLARPLVSAGMIAAELGVTARAAQDLVGELGFRRDNRARALSRLGRPSDTDSGRRTRLGFLCGREAVGWCAMSRGGRPWRGLLII